MEKQVLEALAHRFVHRRCGNGVYFTGYGVGGSLASLASLDLVVSQPKLLPRASYLSTKTSSYVRVVTFAEPRSFSARTAKRAQTRIQKIRYTHGAFWQLVKSLTQRMAQICALQ